MIALLESLPQCTKRSIRSYGAVKNVAEPAEVLWIFFLGEIRVENTTLMDKIQFKLIQQIYSSTLVSIIFKYSNIKRRNDYNQEGRDDTFITMRWRGRWQTSTFLFSLNVFLALYLCFFFLSFENIFIAVIHNFYNITDGTI